MKLEHNDYSGFEIMPSVRLAWAPSASQMFWIAVSRALRAPSRYDTNLVLNIGNIGTSASPDVLRLYGNPQYQDERLLAYEAGYRTALGSHVSVDLATYYDDYNNLQTTEPGTPFAEATPAPAHVVFPLIYENLMYGAAYGLEITANVKLTDRWTLAPGYAFEEIHMHTAPASQDTQTGPFVEGAAPHQSAQLRTHFDLSKTLASDASAYYAGRLSNQGPLPSVTIPGYTRLDLGLTWKPLERISFSLVGQDLLHDHHLEFEDVNGALQSSQIKRSGYAKVTWRF